MVTGLLTSKLQKHVIACDILCIDTVVFEGQERLRRKKLRGKVRLVLSKPLRNASVTLSFKGLCQVFIGDSAARSGLIEGNDGCQYLRRSKHWLLKDGSLPDGVTDLGFEVTVPGHLPPSFDHPDGKVSYSLTAKISMNHTTMSNPLISVKDVSIVHHFLPRYCGVFHMKPPKVCYYGKRDEGEVGFEFNVSKWVPADFATVAVEARVWPLEKVSKLVVNLVQCETFRLPRRDIDDSALFGDPFSLSYPTFQQVTRVPLHPAQTLPRSILDFSLAPTSPGDTAPSFLIRLPLSSPKLRPSYECPLCSIEHHFEIEIHFANGDRTLYLRVPLRVVFIPLLEDQKEGDELPPYREVCRDIPPSYWESDENGGGVYQERVELSEYHPKKDGSEKEKSRRRQDRGGLLFA
ncbi:uncharacterized protein VTP21DRAFT_5217 [Calcarisporiella thermophila]|uniref:uncharacterized protein n=1 Tax=Calcarisporiella thermophila TaxID=911321 RepID=UPI003742F1ED